MNATIFLAQLWGPVILSIGLGLFVSRKYYAKIYGDLQKETLAMLLFGLVGIMLGILQIKAHNSWGSLSEVVISFIGWGLLAKGLMFAIYPKFADRGGNYVVRHKLLSTVGVVMLVIGGYLTWIGYIA